MRRLRQHWQRLDDERRDRLAAHEEAVLAKTPGLLREAIWADGFGADGRRWALTVFWWTGTERSEPAAAYGSTRLRMANGGHIDLHGARSRNGAMVWP